jgi:hypothetical protein
MFGFVQVGTYNGIFVSYSTANTVWKRLGTQAEFPLVIVHQMRWYATGDVLLVATMGRGIYSMLEATKIVGYTKDCACPAYKTLPTPAAASRATPYTYADIIYNTSFNPQGAPPSYPTLAPTPAPAPASSGAASWSPLGVGASVASLCISVFFALITNA